MIDEPDGFHSLNDNNPLPSSRRVENLGSSENPIVLGASPVETRATNEHTRGRATGTTRLTSRRKCPLGAYVEVSREFKVVASAHSVFSRLLTNPDLAHFLVIVAGDCEAAEASMLINTICSLSRRAAESEDGLFGRQDRLRGTNMRSAA
ncbi:unnamed protein product [Strongylus vulgaris]|uniref:Uncharacterized protein n=1 Tax=Strongylus vulgaris TaxID=40348 RepID=A0A3P7IX66_STRVU|nr:unnamed protein product [Strongylus vulgaris]